jgi:hypothetical protein
MRAATQDHSAQAPLKRSRIPTEKAKVMATAQEPSTRVPSKRSRIPTEKAAAIAAEIPTSQENHASACGYSLDPITEDEDDDYYVAPSTPRKQKTIDDAIANTVIKARAADIEITPPPSISPKPVDVDRRLPAMDYTAAGAKKRTTTTKHTAVHRTNAQPDNFEYQPRDRRDREHAHWDLRDREYEHGDKHNHKYDARKHVYKDQDLDDRENEYLDSSDFVDDDIEPDSPVKPAKRKSQKETAVAKKEPCKLTFFILHIIHVTDMLQRRQ